MKRKIELKVGQIWQMPIWTSAGLSKENQRLDVRVINLWKFDGQSLSYNDIGGHLRVCTKESFHSWITRKKAVLIGHYDFDKGKAIAT